MTESETDIATLVRRALAEVCTVPVLLVVHLLGGIGLTIPCKMFREVQTTDGVPDTRKARLLQYCSEQITQTRVRQISWI